MVGTIEIGWRQDEREGKIAVKVIRSGRRTFGLEISAAGEAIARVPERASDRQIMSFVRERQEWIVEKWFLVSRRLEEAKKRPQHDYEENPALEAAYRREAKKRLQERTAFFAPLMGVDYKRISIRAARTRWGSCSAAGNLNFHWKLILMPPEVLDYVVVHELAHRREMNHSPRFWAIVERILPDYKARRRWLKQYGGTV